MLQFSKFMTFRERFSMGPVKSQLICMKNQTYTNIYIYIYAKSTFIYKVQQSWNLDTTFMILMYNLQSTVNFPCR